MPRIFFTSDPHFNHANIIKYCNRPYTTVDQMNSDIIKKWNNTVAKEDIVWCLGDLGMGNKAKLTELIQSLNGRKRLVMGNHDNFSIQTYYDMGFEIVSPFPIIFQEKYILSHVPMKTVPKGYINIYGHIHNSPLFQTYCADGICVCLDRFESFAPVQFEYIVAEQKKFKSHPSLASFVSKAEDSNIMKVER